MIKSVNGGGGGSKNCRKIVTYYLNGPLSLNQQVIRLTQGQEVKSLKREDQMIVYSSLLHVSMWCPLWFLWNKPLCFTEVLTSHLFIYFWYLKQGLARYSYTFGISLNIYVKRDVRLLPTYYLSVIITSYKVWLKAN